MLYKLGQPGADCNFNCIRHLILTVSHSDRCIFRSKKTMALCCGITGIIVFVIFIIIIIALAANGISFAEKLARQQQDYYNGQ